MKGYHKIILVVIASIVTVACMVCLLRFFSPPGPVAETSRVEAPAHLPSITEIQQMINDRGYKIKVDGMVCGACYNLEHSETQKNWDLAYNDQCARQVLK